MLMLCGCAEDYGPLMDALGMPAGEGNAPEAAEDMGLREWFVKIISGDGLPDAAAVRSWVSGLKDAVRQALFGLIRGLVPILICCAVCTALMGRDSVSARSTALCGRIAASMLLLNAYGQALSQTEKALERMRGVTAAAAPFLGAVMTATGAASAGAALSPMGAICTAALESALCGPAMKLCALAGVLAAFGSLSEGLRLGRLFDLLRGALYKGVGAVMTVLTGLLSARGFLAFSRDGAGINAVKYAVESAVPVIGGDLSASLGSLSLSLRAVKAAAGVTALAALCAAALPRLIDLAAPAMALKLIAAAAEPICDRATAACIARFARAHEMLLVTALSAMFMGILLVGVAAALSLTLLGG